MTDSNLLIKEKVEINKNDLFQILKSDYFLQILFNNIKKKKSMDI